jgi:hypothetical protein
MPVKDVDRTHFEASAVADAEIKVDCHIGTINPEVA